MDSGSYPAGLAFFGNKGRFSCLFISIGIDIFVQQNDLLMVQRGKGFMHYWRQSRLLQELLSPGDQQYQEN